MPRRIRQGLQIVCGTLILVVALQLVSAARREDPLGGLDFRALEHLVVTPDDVGSDEPEKKDGKKPEPPPPLPEKYGIIAKSGFLGKPPPAPVIPPKLQGIGSDYAFIQAPSGQVDIVKVGGEVGGVKLLKIGTNRVLVEYQGKEIELTIHWGIGGETLKPAADDKKNAKDKE